MKYYGTSEEVIQNITTSDHLDVVKQANGQSAQISYTQKGELLDVRNAAPKLGSQSKLLTDRVILFSRTFKTNGDGFITVTLDYAQPAALETSVQINGGKTYSLKTSRNSVSILQSPKHKNADYFDCAIAKALIDGISPVDTVNATRNEKGELVFKAGDGELFNKLIKSARDKTGLVAKCLKGERVWKYTSYVWTVTSTSSGVLAANAKINRKVTNIPGPAPKADEGTHWEITNIQSDKGANDEVWKIITTYQTIVDEQTK